MHDKRVRRRRAVLGGLVGLSLILLTAYVGESLGGPFHTLQRGVVAVLSPVQDVASQALKPARDLVGWVGDTLDAKKANKQLRKENAVLRREAVAAQADAAENRQLKGLVGLDGQAGLNAYRAVTARIIGRSPTVWYGTVEIDKGSGDGIHVDQPVVSGAGLAGKVTQVTGSSAIVTLISDHTSGVSARVLDRKGDLGVVVPEVGTPGRMLIQTLPPRSAVRAGDAVVTAGTKSAKYPSLFPPNIPIGTITRVSPDELQLSQQAHLAPAVDLRRLDFVQVLTKPQAGLTAQAP